MNIEHVIIMTATACVQVKNGLAHVEIFENIFSKSHERSVRVCGREWESTNDLAIQSA